jgi:hypothetical protein
MEFRINAKNLFITYPRSELNHDELYEHILTIYNDNELFAIIATENHKDGEKHIHALLKYKKKVDLRDKRKFDYQGRHPNIQAVKNIQATINYIKKDNHWTEHGSIDNATVVKESPYKLAKTLDSEEKFFEECHKLKHSFLYARHAFELNRRGALDLNTILEWDQQGLISNNRLNNLPTPVELSKSLWILGPSGCGKTTWAKKNLPKPLLFITHLDVLQEYRPNYHRCLLFDDMSFAHLPRTAQIHIVDTENPRQIHIRYRIITIPAGTQKCFLSNDIIFIPDDAIDRRLTKINLFT